MTQEIQSKLLGEKPPKLGNQEKQLLRIKAQLADADAGCTTAHIRRKN